MGRNKNALDGNDLVDRQNEEIKLIITERYISDLKFSVPQIIVEDSVQAFKNWLFILEINIKIQLLQ